MRQQANTNMEDFFSASPFSTMRRYDDFFEQMDPFGGSGFSDLRRLEDRMQQQMREMDSQFDKAFADMDRAQQQMDAEIQKGLRQLQEQQPGVRIERKEEKSAGSYRCGAVICHGGVVGVLGACLAIVIFHIGCWHGCA